MMKRKHKHTLYLLPLSVKDVDKKIDTLPDKENTVLMLDALDEDMLAVRNHSERVKRLVEISQDFPKVIITCRTQFFPSDEELPLRTGILRIGPIGMGETREYLFHKLYLSPFKDEEVDKYLRMRYPCWRAACRVF